MRLIIDSFPRLWDGILLTAQVTVLAAILGAILAVTFGLGMLSSRRPVRAVSRTYTEIFRGFPVLVLMFWMVFSAPQLVGFQVAGIQKWLAIVALALNIGAYEAEVVRGGVQSVPRGQREAAVALNFSPYERMRRVIFPQAIPIMIPPWGNLTIQLLKATALVSLVSVRDVLFEARIIINTQGPSAAAPLYTGILVAYFIMAQLIAWFMSWAERRASAGMRAGGRS